MLELNMWLWTIASVCWTPSLSGVGKPDYPPISATSFASLPGLGYLKPAESSLLQGACRARARQSCSLVASAKTLWQRQRIGR